MNSIARLTALTLSAALFLESPVLACGMGAYFPPEQPLLALKAGTKVYHRVAAKWDGQSLAIVKLIPGPTGAKMGATDSNDKLNASFDMMAAAVKPELIVEMARTRGIGATRGAGAPRETATLLSSGATARMIEVPAGVTFAQLKDPKTLKLKAGAQGDLRSVSGWNDDNMENWLQTVRNSGRSVYAAVIEIPADKRDDPDFKDKLKQAAVFIDYPSGGECEMDRDAVLESMGNPGLNVAYGGHSSTIGQRIAPAFHAGGGTKMVTVAQTLSVKAGEPMAVASATFGMQAKAWNQFLLIRVPNGVKLDSSPIPSCSEFAAK